MNKYLGLDLSLTHTGIWVLNGAANDFHALRCMKLRGPQRLDWIERQLDEILDQHPDIRHAGIEGYSYSSTNRAESIGELSGVIRLNLYRRRIPYLVVPPSTLKKFVTGHGHAEKRDVIAAINERFGTEVTDDNVADAGGLALFVDAYRRNGEGYEKHQRDCLKKAEAFGTRSRRSLAPRLLKVKR